MLVSKSLWVQEAPDDKVHDVWSLDWYIVPYSFFDAHVWCDIPRIFVKVIQSGTGRFPGHLSRMCRCQRVMVWEVNGLSMNFIMMPRHLQPGQPLCTTRECIHCCWVPWVCQLQIECCDWSPSSAQWTPSHRPASIQSQSWWHTLLQRSHHQGRLGDLHEDRSIAERWAERLCIHGIVSSLWPCALVVMAWSENIGGSMMDGLACRRICSDGPGFIRWRWQGQMICYSLLWNWLEVGVGGM